MDENIVSSVNAEPVVNVEPQQTEQVNPVESGHEEVATSPQQEQKPVQTPEQNAVYAKLRRETEQKAKDAVISEMYGQSHGIHTYADYQKAIQEQQRRQEAEKKGLDPDFYNDFQNVKDELNSYKREKALLQQDTKLASDPTTGSLYNEWKNDVHQIADQFNVDYETAFTMLTRERLADILNKSKAQTEQETIRKINTNAQTSPGALGQVAETPKLNIWDMDSKDFNAMVEKAKRGELRKL